MSKIVKAMATLGVVAGLGVAALPLGAYAVLPDDGYKTATSAQVQVEVDGAISISSNAPADGIVKLSDAAIMPGTSAELTDPLEVIVSSNTAANYDLYIHTTSADGSMVGENTGAKIKGGDATGESWGYAYAAALADGTGADAFGAYKAVPVLANAEKVNTAALSTNTTDKNVATSGKANASTSYFKFKASTLTTTAADTYNATVVFTAVANS